MEHAVPDTPRLLSPPSRPHPPRTSRFPADRSTSPPIRTQYWTDFRRVTWKDSFAQPAIGTATHAARSLSDRPSSRSCAIVWGSVPSFFSMMQVSQTVWRLLTHGPLSQMKLPPRSSAKDTWSGWWISPTQCPRYLSDANFAASSLEVRNTSRSAGMAVKRHFGTAGHWATLIA